MLVTSLHRIRQFVHITSNNRVPGIDRLYDIGIYDMNGYTHRTDIHIHIEYTYTYRTVNKFNSMRQEAVSGKWQKLIFYFSFCQFLPVGGKK